MLDRYIYEIQKFLIKFINLQQNFIVRFLTILYNNYREIG